ncbi:MAG: rubrerythrin [Methanomicrobiales archaeon]|nr:rubrerythrin [Methanomicrobiales archaeon]
MPDFATAFTVKASDRPLSGNEMVRAIRLCVADEYEAIQVYTQLAESITDERARAVLLDIADEERVHAGEFLRLLKILTPDEEGFYTTGAKEVDDTIALLLQPPVAKSKGDGKSTIGSLKE